MTFNIRHGLGSDRRQDLSRIVPVLRESGADLICLQEVDCRLPRSGFFDQAAWLAGQLGFTHALGVNFGIPSAGMGNAILSRWPFYSTWNKRLPSAGEPRGLLCVEVHHFEAGQLTFLCTHWGLSSAQRMAQAKVCGSLVVAQTAPCILCGDLNAGPGDDEVKKALQLGRLEDAGPAGVLTYPADNPGAKIDYVLYSADWKLIRARVISTLASDHLPVVADLELLA